MSDEQPAFEIRTSLSDPMQGIRIYANGHAEGSIYDAMVEAAKAEGAPCLIINRIHGMLKMARAGKL